MPRVFGSLGDELQEEGNLPVQRERAGTTETEGRGKKTRGFCNRSGLWSLTADQIMLSVVMLK